MHAAYATNVGHYDHVLKAMSQTFEEVTLVRRPEPTPRQLQKLQRYGVPSGVVRILQRRVRQQSPIPHSRRALGVGDLILTAAVQTGRKIPAPLFRKATDFSSRRIADLTSDADVLHFVEGLGHRALDRNEYHFSICERRAMHHAVFEGDFPAIGDFPHQGRIDPIGDFLDAEYERASKILVYSQAAKESFLKRGFDNNKVVVAPIGIPVQLPVRVSIRDRYKLAFVGRGDVYKGLDLAVACVAKLGQRYRLHVAGPMKAEVLEWLRRQPGVVYEGVLDKNQLRDLYSTSQLLVLPSIEAFGLAVAEAVHHGLHVVCAPETGIVEYLPHESYTQVAGRDPDEWASALGELLESELYSRLPRDSSSRLERLELISWESAALKLSKVYADLH